MSNSVDSSVRVEPEKSTALKEGLRITWIGMAVNILLVIFKLWAGFLSKSQALIADGIHSLSDLFSDVVVIFGLKWGRKMADEDHPYGHARIETISSMIVGLLLITVGIGLIYNAIQSIYIHEHSKPGVLALYAAGISVLLKEALFWFTYRIGKKIKSLALIANAWHHRTDAFSSVAVLVGVAAVYYNPDWFLADAFAALLVTFFIIKVGAHLVWQALKELSDTAPDTEILEQLYQTAETVEGVINVHDLTARLSGSHIFVEVHIVVKSDLTVREGHDIAVAVRDKLLNDFGDVTRVLTHVDPAE